MFHLTRSLLGFTMLLATASLTCQLAAQPAQSDPVQEKLIKEAEEFFRKGTFDDAQRKWNDHRPKKPAQPLPPPTPLDRARMHLKSRFDQQTGRQLLEAILAAESHDPEPFLLNASVAIADGRMTDAIFSCQTALALSGNEQWTAEQRKAFQREARAGLAAAFEWRKDWTSALRHLKAWEELEPDNAQVKVRLAKALFMVGGGVEAQPKLFVEPKLELKTPAVGSALQLVANLFTPAKDAQKLADEDTQKAHEWFQKAIEKYPTNPRVYQAYAGWLLDIGKVADAKKIVKKAIEVDPKSPETRKLMVLLAMKEDCFEEAEKLLNELPFDFFVSNMLEQIWKKRGKLNPKSRYRMPDEPFHEHNWNRPPPIPPKWLKPLLDPNAPPQV